MKLITVHGIRTNGLWARKLEENETLTRAGVQFLHFNYGYFGLHKFCFGPSRNAIIQKFITFYDENIEQGERPCLIAHSFGTWITTVALKTYSVIRLDRVIFFGSILSPDTNLDIFFKKDQVKSMLHEVGNKDGVVALSRWVLGKDAGKSGKVGFSTVQNSYKSRFTQTPYALFDHGAAAFMQRHISEQWVPFLLPQRFSVSSRILRDEALKWIDYSVPDGLSFPEKQFRCRIDRLGNYYARYKLAIRNDGSETITRIPISISADSADQIEDMQFLAMDANRSRLTFEITEENFHRWKIDIRIPALEPGEQREIRCKFKISKTIRFSGDFDQFRIRRTKSASVVFHSYYRLVSPRFYTLRDARLTGEIPSSEEKNNDGTYRYSVNHINKSNEDGIIFYFEGCYTESVVEKYAYPTQKALNILNLRYLIRNAKESDLAKIEGLEMDIEGRDGRALGGTLMERFRMFPDGFLVAETKGKIVGYIESLIWTHREFSNFEDIKHFPLHHDFEAKELYAIFLAVAKPHRGRRLGPALLAALEEVAANYRLERVTLVAKAALEEFYAALGYQSVRNLPTFLQSPTNTVVGVLMEKRLRL